MHLCYCHYNFLSHSPCWQCKRKQNAAKDILAYFSGTGEASAVCFVWCIFFASSPENNNNDTHLKPFPQFLQCANAFVLLVVSNIWNLSPLSLFPIFEYLFVSKIWISEPLLVVFDTWIFEPPLVVSNIWIFEPISLFPIFEIWACLLGGVEVEVGCF